MKALKIIGIIVLVLVALFFIVALFLPSKVHMEQSITINREPAVIFKQVNNFHNWAAWSPWAETDSLMVNTYSGPELGVGAKMSWKSKKHGDGSMTIVESLPYTSVKYDLDFMEQGTAQSYFNFVPEGDSTKVTWGLDIPKLKYPVERFFGVLMPGMMNQFFKSGLDRLKEVSEGMPNAPKFELTQLDETKAITILDSCSWDQMDQVMGKDFSELTKFLAKHKDVAMAGHPFTIYHKWDEENHFSVFENGIPVDRAVNGRGNIQFKDIPTMQVLKGTYFGSYEGSGSMYSSMDEYMKEYGLQMNGGPIESYITDPSIEPDTTKWQTNIYFPIK